MSIVLDCREARSTKTVIWLFVVCLALLGARLKVVAQDFASVSGRVIDESLRQPIAGVMVTLSPDGEIIFTDSEGRFEFRRVVPGILSLHFRSAFHGEKRFGPFFCREGEQRLVEVSLQPVEIRAPAQQVTADRGEGAGVIRYGAKAIEKTHASTVGQFLQQNGYHVVSDGRVSHVSIRGFAPQSVLVLIDGQPINPDGSSVDLSTIPTGSIKSVEVYTSGAASLYGANALGGAINMVSKQPTERSENLVRLSGTGGSYGLKSGDMTLTLPRGHSLGLSLDYEYSEQRNDYPYEHPYLGEQRRQNNFKRSYSLSLSASHESIKGLGLSVRRFNSHIGVPGAVFQETSGSPIAKRQNQLYTLSYFWRYFECSADYREIVQAFRDEQAFVPYSRDYLQIGRQLNVRWHRPLFRFCSTSLGGEFLSESFFNDDYLSPSKTLTRVGRRTESLFTATKFFASWRKIRADAENRYRVDWIEGERHTSPFFGASIDFRLFVDIGAEAAYSESYRNPPLDALFWSDDVFAVGNPDLRPETAITREAGFHLQAGRAIRLGAQVVWFENDLDNLIIWRRQFDGKYQPVNIDHSEYSGRELRVSVSTKSEQLSASYSRNTLSAINRSERLGYYGKAVPFRPDRTEQFHLTLSRWHLRLQYTYSFTGTRFIREANTKSQAPYQLHDLTLQADFTLYGVGYTLEGAVYNLADKKYELLERMPMPPRTIALKLTLEI